MQLIPIYNQKGTQVSELHLPEEVTIVSGRTSKGHSGLYYKGVGVKYGGHSNFNPAGYINVRKHPVFYYGYNVTREAWVGKSGIFQERCQPFFSDFIGTCGPKELKIIANSKGFEKTAVIVKDCIEYDLENNQRYFILDYGKEGRTSWIEDRGAVKDLLDLLEYMLRNDWNFPWDKGAIGDVSASGNVHDVADMFKSKEFIHKLGTVYSILYSMNNKSKGRYYEFITTAGYRHKDDKDFLFIAISLLERFGVDTKEGFSFDAKDEFDAYYHLVGNCLLWGRNCGYVEDAREGEKIREQYLNRFFNQIPKEADRIRSFS
jgi:hypothetical protein